MNTGATGGVDTRQLRRSVNELSDFVLHSAAATEALVGFSWRPCSKAPGTYPALQRAFQYSMATRDRLPVSDENSSSVIYRHADVNLAFRFWHDSLHVLRGLDFTPPQELHLASVQLSALARAGRGPETLTWRLLHADLVGQVYLSAVGRCFPEDQREFVLTSLEFGLDRAILWELGEVLPPTIQIPSLEAATA